MISPVFSLRRSEENKEKLNAYKEKNVNIDALLWIRTKSVMILLENSVNWWKFVWIDILCVSDAG